MLASTDDPQLLFLRRRRFAVRVSVSALWLLGVLLTVKSGLDPGPWWPRSGRPWPYPIGHVLIEIAKISIVSLGLYDLLRPQEGAVSWARTARAAALLFGTLVWIAVTSWTDQPGYAYATGSYVFIVTGLLFVVLLVQGVMAGVRSIQAVIRRGKHAA